MLSELLGKGLRCRVTTWDEKVLKTNRSEAVVENLSRGKQRAPRALGGAPTRSKQRQGKGRGMRSRQKR